MVLPPYWEQSSISDFSIIWIVITSSKHYHLKYQVSLPWRNSVCCVVLLKGRWKGEVGRGGRIAASYSWRLWLMMVVVVNGEPLHPPPKLALRLMVAVSSTTASSFQGQHPPPPPPLVFLLPTIWLQQMSGSAQWAGYGPSIQPIVGTYS